MSKNKSTAGGRAKKKAAVSLVRSSAAEYLTFVAASGQGGVEAVYADENVWLSQKMMGLLYAVETHTINYHLKKVFDDAELEAGSVIRNFRITAADGKGYDTQHYNLSGIIAVGYKVNSERAVQFRKWATGIIESFTIKGFAMDDERLKNDGSILGKQYFEEQLQRIREIRLSERKFYQKITDIYATSIDYDVTAAATKRFFATVQNKLHWAIHGQTAAEVILSRADATKDRMGLTTWKDAPNGKIQKFDVVVILPRRWCGLQSARPGLRFRKSARWLMVAAVGKRNGPAGRPPNACNSFPPDRSTSWNRKTARSAGFRW